MHAIAGSRSAGVGMVRQALCTGLGHRTGGAVRVGALLEAKQFAEFVEVEMTEAPVSLEQT